MENLIFRKASLTDLEEIWPIFQDAIKKRKEEGSSQWQDGYPNLDSINTDILNEYAYVALNDSAEIVGYIAIIDEVEPAYEVIEGEWNTKGSYTTVHRIAVSRQRIIKGLGTWLLNKAIEYAASKRMASVRADTNFDNLGMLKVFEKLGFVYCGTVYFRGSARRAYEKVLD